jgi:hypothetical protein
MTVVPTVAGPTGADVRRAARWCADALMTQRGDWGTTVPDLTWTVRQAVAHAAQACIWYAVDLSAGDADLCTWEPHVKTESEPPDLVSTLLALADVLGSVLDSVPAAQRGYHPFGSADSSGFAAMGCDELLIHTDDALRAFGVAAVPPSDLCDMTVRRLFPWAPTDVDPWSALRWANGRIALPGLPRTDRWRWHCAPLSEWDGTNPNQSAP